MKNFVEDEIPSTFFAVYSDLSGATLFYEESGRYKTPDFDNTVDAHWFMDAGYLWFFEVDDNFAKQAKGDV